MSSKEPKKPVMPARAMLIGDEKIPREVIEALSDQHVQIFLREPDPEEWPPEMQHLAQYISRDEEIEFTIAQVVAAKDALLAEALDRWTAAILKDLTEDKKIGSEFYRKIFDEMAAHLNDLLVRSVARF